MSTVSRSLLFVPGDRLERFEKAASSGAHEVIIDLEDAVAPSAKSQAREAVSSLFEAGQSATLRINAADTDWFEDDIQLLKQCPGATVMLAKAEADSIRRLSSCLPDTSVIALIETVRGFMELRRLTSVEGVSRLAFGSIDFSVDSGIADEDDAMTAVRTKIVLESCFAGLLAPADGVSVNYKDQEKMQSDAARSRQLGFGGKLCIHPKQVVEVNAAYCPSSDKVDWAQRVLSAFETSRGGVTTVDGKMVDKPVVLEAQNIIAEASRY